MIWTTAARTFWLICATVSGWPDADTGALITFVTGVLVIEPVPAAVALLAVLVPAVIVPLGLVATAVAVGAGVAEPEEGAVVGAIVGASVGASVPTFVGDEELTPGLHALSMSANTRPKRPGSRRIRIGGM